MNTVLEGMKNSPHAKVPEVRELINALEALVKVFKGLKNMNPAVDPDTFRT